MAEFKAMNEAVAKLGAAQALADLNAGFKQRMYRKDRNSKNNAILEAVKGNADLKKSIEAALAKKTA